MKENANLKTVIKFKKKNKLLHYIKLNQKRKLKKKKKKSKETSIIKI